MSNNRKMQRGTAPAFGLLLSLALAGCGGGGEPSAEPVTNVARTTPASPVNSSTQTARVALAAGVPTCFDTVEKLYIAFYQRPADPAGLAYWSSVISAANGNASAVINAFATSNEATALYGPINGGTIGRVIDAFYAALFGHAPDTAGKAFYVNGFNAGTYTAATIALNVLNGAIGTDATSVANKTKVATSFTQLVDGRQLVDPSFGSGLNFAVTYDANDLVAARNLLMTVTASSSSVLTTAQVTLALQTQIANSSDPLVSNQLVADCYGNGCGASSNFSYSGTGVGAWRYTNTGSSPASVDLSISGTTSRKNAILLFSNGGINTAPTLPVTGNLAAATVDIAQLASSPGAKSATEMKNDGHAAVLERNRLHAMEFIRNAKATRTGETARSGAEITEHPSPSIGATRTWNEVFGNPNIATIYNTVVAGTCSIPSGRTVVFWVDPAATQAGLVASADIAAFKAAVCGVGGGFHRLNMLLGDFWGPEADKYPNLIKDGPTLQDINIVIVNAPASTTWGGYADGAFSYLKSYYSYSNEAVMFFIAASGIPNNSKFAISALIHEATHVINWYQRTIVRKMIHESWLEETSAIMSEDIVTPAVSDNFNYIASAWLPHYMTSGAGFSYTTNWAADTSNSYAMGGSFGAFLNRRFGLSIYKQLITGCNDAYDTVNSSYYCLDNLLRQNGSGGFANEFARFGASVFGTLSANSPPTGYGYPARSDEGYGLQAIDLASPSFAIPKAAALSTNFPPATHTYQVDKIAGTTYSKKGILVPSGTSLTVVIPSSDRPLTIAGVLVNAATGKPTVGYVVEACIYHNGIDGACQGWSYSITDSNGNFSFVVQDATPYFLLVSPPGNLGPYQYYTSTTTTGLTTNGNLATPLSISGTDVAGLSLKLQ